MIMRLKSKRLIDWLVALLHSRHTSWTHTKSLSKATQTKRYQRNKANVIQHSQVYKESVYNTHECIKNLHVMWNMM